MTDARLRAMATSAKPRYKNDCKSCTFVGTINKYDVYTCMQGGDWPTLVARFGNKPRDYLSGSRLTLDHIHFALSAGWEAPS